MTTTITPTTDPTTTHPTPAATGTPQWVSLTTTGHWTGGQRTEIRARQFEFVVDEPSTLGGTDTGANPLEYVLGGFQGCLAVVLNTVSGELGYELHGVEITTSGTLDLRGFAGIPGVSPQFQKVDGEVHLRGDLTEAQFTRLIDETERRCPAYNLFKDSGVTPELRWQLTF